MIDVVYEIICVEGHENYERADFTNSWAIMPYCKICGAEVAPIREVELGALILIETLKT